ncbi:MAG: 23S rRNA (adenine(2503)-C(2))-methyltransferase RlmN [Desulfomicrobium sp.]|jgi:23S rRNA (adenine2503-C2)-methyltransferase|nr:23S rRNA (adenine(2503)-C(2))-methyltransferase RlmN [Desulfomicrobium sp.]NLV97405.1 23S rRNA (adenine(2503)-C(2))-methyltransferase RlmN [Desulfovibrionales bacterium]
MNNILELPYQELEKVVANMGHQTFRAQQLWQWLWRKGERNFSSMTNIAKSFQEHLAQFWSVTWPEVVAIQCSQDGTVKLLLELEDGLRVETVLIPDKDRYTQCLSCQIGCPMGCTFCSTGQMGFVRNMSGGEIAAQVLVARDYLRKHHLAQEIKNLVYMGMGEPLLNWPEVKKSLDILSHPQGLEFSRRRITLSTCALPGKLALFAAEGLALPAISLHAPTQEIREKLMPGAAKWPVEELIKALQKFPLKPRERVTIEYILIQGINDSLEHARQLVRLLAHLKCKINLIAYNPAPGINYKAPAPKDVLAFEELLRSKGFTATLRKSKGQDIAAACGQLKTEMEQAGSLKPDREC